MISRSWKVKLLLYFLIGFCFIPILAFGQKLPDIRVDQKEVTEETLFIEANRARLLGDFDEAETKLNLLIDRYEDKAVFHYELARVYNDIGEWDQGIKSIRLALERDPQNEWYWQYLINLAEEKDDQNTIIEGYTALRELFPDRHFYYENIAFHQLSNEQPDEALKTLNQLEKKAGVHFETSRQKHLIYDAKGDTKAAMAELDHYIEYNPADVRMLQVAAGYAMNLSQPQIAKSYYQKILDVDPEHTQARAAMIRLESISASTSDKFLAYLSDREVSLDDKLIQLIPILNDYQMGNTGYTAENLESFGQILIEQYGETDKTMALMGDVYSLQEKLSEASQSYIKSIELNDENFMVWEQLLYTLSDLNRVDDLQFYAQDAMDIFPNQPIPYAFYGQALAMEGKFNQVEGALRDARMRCGSVPELNAQVNEIERRIDQMKGQ